LNTTAAVEIVHLPDALPEDKGVALVINIHALGSNAKGQQDLSKFDEVADKEKFVVVYPEGYSKAKLGTPFPAPKGQNLLTWNAGGCCSDVPIDDIGFFRELIKEVVGKCETTK
jgi:polyhydroxybutyrate depolymerase